MPQNFKKFRDGKGADGDTELIYDLLDQLEPVKKDEDDKRNKHEVD